MATLRNSDIAAAMSVHIPKKPLGGCRNRVLGAMKVGGGSASPLLAEAMGRTVWLSNCLSQLYTTEFNTMFCFGVLSSLGKANHIASLVNRCDALSVGTRVNPGCFVASP